MQGVFALFLAAHAFIHSSYFVHDSPDPRYPFRLDRGVLARLGLQGIAFPLAVSLATLTLLAYVCTSLALMGWLLPVDWWRPLAVLGSLGSLGLLLIGFHPWLLAGVALLVASAALLRARRAVRRLDRLSESYWELRYEHGQLSSRVARLEGSNSPVGQEQAANGGKVAFVPLSSPFLCWRSPFR